MEPKRNGDLPQEVTITRLLYRRLEEEDCLRPGDRQSIAYRISEIMVAAKNLYTESLPRLLQQSPGEQVYSAFEELAGLRMVLLHLHDLIGDFEDEFMDAMTHQREADGTTPDLSGTPESEDEEEQ
ncbi:MAG: hypothetical protein HY319_29575 [Armatimonadetes bacterium]|nr:hypothetical protein [Armatimonadota bacterium]